MSQWCTEGTHWRHNLVFGVISKWHGTHRRQPLRHLPCWFSESMGFECYQLATGGTQDCMKSKLWYFATSHSNELLITLPFCCNTINQLHFTSGALKWNMLCLAQTACLVSTEPWNSTRVQQVEHEVGHSGSIMSQVLLPEVGHSGSNMRSSFLLPECIGPLLFTGVHILLSHCVDVEEIYRGRYTWLRIIVEVLFGMKRLQHAFGMCIDVLNEGNKRGCTGSPLGLPVGQRAIRDKRVATFQIWQKNMLGDATQSVNIIAVCNHFIQSRPI